MKNTHRLILAAAAGLVAGAVIGHFGPAVSGAAPRVGAAPTVAETPAQAGAHEQAGQEALLTALRKQIADLERSLAYRMEQVNELQHAVARRDERLADLATASIPAAVTAEEAEQPERTERGPRENYEARLERLRTEAPEEFAELQRRREEMQQRMTQLHQDRRAFLEAVDTTRMTDAQQENHAKLLEAIDAANAFRQQLSAGDWSQMSAEQRAEGFTALRTIGELYEQERRYILEETGRAYGEDGTRFADYIENVIENTSLLPNFGRGRGGGRRRDDAPPPAPPGAEP